ncbi:MAG: hypothetical protein BWY19_00047 [bacterium ADurb.Bin212]|nr:MAG: hypothetical protein BWY19_00047 [bacterium ADurb.Bin212]
MEDKNILKFSSIIITFFIFLAGAVMSYWIYSLIISRPQLINDKSGNKIEINQSKLTAIQDSSHEPIATPEQGYGRENPFLPYK